MGVPERFSGKRSAGGFVRGSPGKRNAGGFLEGGEACDGGFGRRVLQKGP